MESAAVMMRSFVAVEPDPALRDWLGRAIAVLREAHHPNLRWGRPENIHLTLKFLGDVHRDRVGEVLAVIESSARMQESFVLPFGDFGQFGGARAPGILWLGLQPGEELNRLTALQAGLEHELQRIGFAVERRPWKPHLTLARNPRHREVGDWRRLARSVEKPPALEVREWTLFRSDLTDEGPRYSVLGRAPLGATGANRKT